MNKILLLIIILGVIGIFCVQQQVNSLGVNDNNATNNTNPAKLHLRLDWNNNEIVNGKEFNIEIRAFNLKDKHYDLKVYLYEDDKNSPISQTRDEDFKWISSDKYVKDFFVGPGNQSDNIKLRINEDYKALEGGATVIARIRESGTSPYIQEQEDIFVLKNKFSEKDDDENEEDNLQQNSEMSETNYASSISGKVIRIETNKKTESIKTQNNIIYESKNELIKRYSIYGFIILIIVFLILLILRLI